MGESQSKLKNPKKDPIPPEMLSTLQKATVGGGCFWCLEAVFQRLKGVQAVESGYAGGHVKNPTYEQVCSGSTGHAEVAQITFDPTSLPLKELYKVFFMTHDPTTLNRQGNDSGTQYRSVIFYHDDNQKETALQVIKEIEDTKYFKDKIVTEVSPLSNYYKAEDYHQNYYNDNPNQGYCKAVVKSKVDKFLKLFPDKAEK